MILAVVPARGGSKRIPKKNIKKIKNKSLIQIAAECIKKSKFIDEMVLSSDDERIILEGERFGLKTYFTRPKYLSGDRVGDIPVLKHALKKAEEKQKVLFDIILMIQPTSPTRQPKDIENLIKKIIDKDYDTVWTVHKVEKQFHPDKQLKINENGYLRFFTSKGKDIVINQELTETYMKNGIGYAITREFLLGEKSGYILHQGPIVNIDNKNDLINARKIIKNLENK